MASAYVESDPFPFNVFENAPEEPVHKQEKHRRGPGRPVVFGVAAMIIAGFVVRDIKVEAEGQQVKPIGHELEVNLETLPSSLPTAVAKEVSRVFAIEVDHSSANGIDVSSIEGGSAVQLTSNTVLTAGHVLIMDSFQVPKGSCSEVQLADRENSDTTNAIQGYWATFNNNRYSRTPDLGVVKIAAAAEPPFIGPVQPLPLAPPAHAGDPVFFVNFETPLNSDLVNYNLQKPIIFGGIVSAEQTNGDYLIADNLMSYTSFDQSVLTPGGSGGAVFNQAGELLGLSIETSSPSPIDQSAASFGGVQLEGSSPEEQIGLSVVQPVTRTILNQVENQPLSLDCS